MRRGRALGLGLAAAIIVLAADQLTKAWAVGHLPPGRRVVALPGVLLFNLTSNSGATLGTFAGHNGVLALITVGLLIAISVLMASGMASSPATVISLGAILGGGMSNLLDRLRLSAVVDFIQLRPLPTYFNLADLAIRIGALALVLSVATGWLKARRRA